MRCKLLRNNLTASVIGDISDAFSMEETVLRKWMKVGCHHSEICERALADSNTRIFIHKGL